MDWLYVLPARSTLQYLLEKRGVVEGGRSMGKPVKAVGVGGWPVYYRFGNTGLSCEIVNIFFCLAVEVTI
jgi:hypothetical protein